MAKNNKKIMNHHKRNHNGRQRSQRRRSQERRPTYFRPCGCRRENVANRNKAIAYAIKTSRPTMEWSSLRGCWVPHVAKHIKRRFGRACATSTLTRTWTLIRPPLREHPHEVSDLTENGELNTQEY